MPLTLLVILLNFIASDLSLLKFLALYTSEFHKFCDNYLPTNSAYRDLKTSLVCGSSIYNSKFIDSIKALGAIHLFVVSGFHIQIVHSFLSLILKRSKFCYYYVTILIFAYGAICSFSPPVMRAIAQFQIKKWISSHSGQICLLSGCTLLFLESTFWNSKSLQLSWVCSLIISQNGWKVSSKLIMIFIYTVFILSPNHLANPISLILSMPLTFFVGSILLPTSFLEFIFPKSEILSDPFWELFIFIGEITSKEIQPIFFQLEISTYSNWILILIFNIFICLTETRKSRSKIWQKSHLS